MLFGEDSLKGLKKELKSAGADMSFVKGWQKSFDKVIGIKILLLSCGKCGTDDKGIFGIV